LRPARRAAGPARDAAAGAGEERHRDCLGPPRRQAAPGRARGARQGAPGACRGARGVPDRGPRTGHEGGVPAHPVDMACPPRGRAAVPRARRSDPGQLKELLNVALPRGNFPLRDWQAVVIGGGVINGLTLAGAWPGERLDALMKGEPVLQARWNRALEMATAMA